jgi:hypothetical protein
MFPSLTNIDQKIYSNLVNYKRQNDYASIHNVFIRVFSGAVVKGNQGLIITSNNDLPMFDAAGESIYGNERMTGVLGKSFNGKAVLGGHDRGLRPTPLVTGFSVKEGKDQISREATLTIDCFSLDQLEMMQEYFLQPGYSLAVEYGWNTDQAATALITTTNSNGTSIGAKGIVDNIAQRNLDYNELHNWRVSSKGDWDCFLGFIVGGNISSQGDTYNLEVRMRGAPGLPTFLQTHQQILQTGTDGKVIDKQSDTDTYGASLFGAEETSPEKRRFRKMFNSLPATRIIKVIKNILDAGKFKLRKEDFINFDDVIDDKLKITDWPYADKPENGIKAESYKKDKLQSKQRYISMRLAMEILNNNGSLSAYKIGKKNVNVKIDIENARIGAFPYMYSTNKKALAIPGVIPNFGVLFFGGAKYEFLDEGNIKVTPTAGKPSTYEPVLLHANGTGVDFVQYEPLKKNRDEGIMFDEVPGYWGFLKDLYVNFDMFCEKIVQPNKNIREILLDILNEMTAAVNSFWFFQIVEDDSDSKNGNVKLTVVDENWVGNLGNEANGVKYFHHSGTSSPFLESTLDLSLTGELVNYLVCKRLQLATNPNERYTNVSDNSFFSKNPDLFVNAVQINGQDKIYTEAGKDVFGNDVKKEDVNNGEGDKPQIDKTGIDWNKSSSEQKHVQDAGEGWYDTYTIKDENGKVVLTYTEKFSAGNQKLGTSIESGNAEILASYQKSKTDKQTKAQNNATSNLEKIDISIDPMVEIVVGDGNDRLASLDVFNQYYRVYCYDDTSYLDLLKQNAFADKGGLSHPLPIKYTFKVLGTSGMRRGDMFSIIGIPKQYTDHGIFQITGVEHSIAGMNWYTTVTGEYRVFQSRDNQGTKTKEAKEWKINQNNVIFGLGSIGANNDSTIKFDGSGPTVGKNYPKGGYLKQKLTF